MSFMDAYREKTPVRRTQTRGSPALEECQNLAGAVFQLTTKVTAFKRLIDSLGTPKDTEALRSRLRAQREALQEAVKDTSIRLKELNKQASVGSLESSVQANHAKLVKDFHGVLKDFQKAQRECMEKESMYTPQEDEPERDVGPGPSFMSSSGSGAVGADEEPLLDRRESTGTEHGLVRLDNEIEYNEAVIAERDQGINEITQQIHEVNEIFQDLAVLVNEQGGMLEDIEANIVKTNMKVKDAGQELKQAQKSQKRSRAKMLCMSCVLFVVLIAIILIVLEIH
mmetsp:Transcript_24235/g.29388  ORF Transcript_24235/g.29388 Transcript_24235/m.29388 type:complete len:283 (-) Transcript_24235:106-954(-)|eukprot:CAMPEP_0197854078 /NCGR_PEP_ID=MMETSP1438-20131217/23995_1 /TAXON_ID=1461541 /ORGANISM="Pterosperma sp., Strain CCMP1384" /LENGTH=282 /DNA_ID=CAMNT_0043468713 /DNA_START=159 /DNA_END=1007 /DNA_ORIENTATION=+